MLSKAPLPRTSIWTELQARQEYRRLSRRVAAAHGVTSLTVASWASIWSPVEDAGPSKRAIPGLRACDRRRRSR